MANRIVNRAVPRFKHRPVGPRKGTGTFPARALGPSKKKRPASSRRTAEAEYQEIGRPLIAGVLNVVVSNRDEFFREHPEAAKKLVE